MAKTITINFENMDKCALVEAVLTGMGIQYGVKKYERTAKAEDTKVEEEVKTVEPAPKSEDNFDVELYHEVARELGVMGAKGKVYRFARTTVYDGMSEVKKSKRGKMTAKVRKALLAQLLTVAQKDGIQWYIDKVAEDKVAKAQ